MLSIINRTNENILTAAYKPNEREYSRGPPSGSWGNIKAAGILTADSSGTLLWWLNVPDQDVGTETTAIGFAPGALDSGDFTVGRISANLAFGARNVTDLFFSGHFCAALVFDEIHDDATVAIIQSALKSK